MIYSLIKFKNLLAHITCEALFDKCEIHNVFNSIMNVHLASRTVKHTYVVDIQWIFFILFYIAFIKCSKSSGLKKLDWMFCRMNKILHWCIRIFSIQNYFKKKKKHLHKLEQKRWLWDWPKNKIMSNSTSYHLEINLNVSLLLNRSNLQLISSILITIYTRCEVIKLVKYMHNFV